MRQIANVTRIITAVILLTALLSPQTGWAQDKAADKDKKEVQDQTKDKKKKKDKKAAVEENEAVKAIIKAVEALEEEEKESPKLQSITEELYQLIDKTAQAVNSDDIKVLEGMLWDAGSNQPWSEGGDQDDLKKIKAIGMEQTKKLTGQINPEMEILTIKNVYEGDPDMESYLIYIPLNFDYPEFILATNLKENEEAFQPLIDERINPTNYLYLEVLKGMNERLQRQWFILIR